MRHAAFGEDEFVVGAVGQVFASTLNCGVEELASRCGCTTLRAERVTREAEVGPGKRPWRSAVGLPHGLRSRAGGCQIPREKARECWASTIRNRQVPSEVPSIFPDGIRS